MKYKGFLVFVILGCVSCKLLAADDPAATNQASDVVPGQVTSPKAASSKAVPAQVDPQSVSKPGGASVPKAIPAKPIQEKAVSEPAVQEKAVADTVEQANVIAPGTQSPNVVTEAPALPAGSSTLMPPAPTPPTTTPTAFPPLAPPAPPPLNKQSNPPAVQPLSPPPPTPPTTVMPANPPLSPPSPATSGANTVTPATPPVAGLSSQLIATVVPPFAEPGLTPPALPKTALGEVELDKAPIDPTDFASLQRGARIFMDVCSGCHSLKYVRYDSLAKAIEITDENGKILEKVVKDNLMFVGDTLSSPIETAMSAKDAETWFGIAPPDLTLEARYRGVDWLYTYLRSFYYDPSRPWGVNNLVFPDVAMPHVLINLQGTQILTDAGLKLAKKGTMTEQEYDAAMGDLVNFLGFVAEPVQVERREIGAWVLVFLGIFLVFSFLLKREYWKDVHK